MNPYLKVIKAASNSELDTLVANFVEEIYLAPSPLETQEAKKDRTQQQFQEMFDHLEDSMTRGWISLMHQLQDEDNQAFETLMMLIDFDDTKWEEFQRILSDSKTYDRLPPIYEIIGLSEDQMEILYKAARRLYERQKVSDAAEAFLALIVMNTSDYRFWMGYGLTLQFMGELEEAFTALSVAITLHPNLSVCYLHLAKCLFGLDRREEALANLQLAREMASKEEEEQGLVQERCQEFEQQVN